MATANIYMTVSDVCDLIKLREKMNYHETLRTGYVNASFSDQSSFTDYLNHAVLCGEGTNVLLVLSKLFSKKRYPELAKYFTNDIKKRLRKHITSGTGLQPDPQVNNDDSFSMESSSSCEEGGDDNGDVASAASSRLAIATTAESESYAKLRSENDRLVRLLSEHKAMLSILVEHATIDEGWRPFIKALVEKKM